MELLDACYQKSINGISKISPPIDQFADDYLKKNPDPAKAAKSMIQHQIAKCTTSGVLTGFGGLVTLPVSIPANMSSVLYVQMRMIACTAYMAGLDVYSDQVQTLIYACLAGVSVNGVFKKFGIKLGEKVANGLIKKIPGQALVKINQKVGFRLVTKFGQKGLLNLGIIGNRAYNLFFKGDFSTDDNTQSDINFSDFFDSNTADRIIDVEFTETTADSDRK